MDLQVTRIVDGCDTREYKKHNQVRTQVDVPSKDGEGRWR